MKIAFLMHSIAEGAPYDSPIRSFTYLRGYSPEWALRDANNEMAQLFGADWARLQSQIKVTVT